MPDLENTNIVSQINFLKKESVTNLSLLENYRVICQICREMSCPDPLVSLSSLLSPSRAAQQRAAPASRMNHALARSAAPVPISFDNLNKTVMRKTNNGHLECKK